jgi:hypothetical protein
MKEVTTLKRCLLTVVFGLSAALLFGNGTLHFSEDGKFKIVQFTDLHWESGSKGHEWVTLSMEMVLDKEKPDLVVLTGDIVTSGNPFLGWREVAAPMVKRGIHWVATLGNHDSEGEVTRELIYDSIRAIPFNIGPSDEQYGAGIHDFCFPVKNQKNGISALLYFFDSHAYVKANMPGYYDWIKLEQVQWYKNESDKYKKLNNGKPLPALAFLHIPLPEYKEVMQLETTIGHKNENVCSPELNSGLFAAMVEMQDVIGVFTGHDHENDFIGNLHGIALAYGRYSGINGYGNLKIGGRAIELVQDRFQFNSWITTVNKNEFYFQFPSKSMVEFDPSSLIPPVKTAKLKTGVSYRYFEGKMDSVVRLKTMKALKSGTTDNFDVSLANRNDHFGFIFDAFIEIPENGLYSFYLHSDDGAILYINDRLLIDNDGSHSPRLKKGSIGLQKGFHKIQVMYFQDYKGKMLEIGIKGLSMQEGPIPNSMLFTE